MKTLMLTLLLMAGVIASAPQDQRAQQAAPDDQLHRAIQGVWRNIARVIPATTTPGDRLDPFGHVPVGTQTDVQPGLLIFTVKHYSRTTDIAVQPRPTTGYAIPGQPTLEELQARWGQFAANAGTYELAGDVLTLRVIVSKEPRDQAAGGFARLRVQLENGILSLTPIERPEGRIAAGVTSRYARVE
jgi:hypothetical protein